MQSLLGVFYSRIKGSQEDIASEGLAYILQRSYPARTTVSKLLKADCGLEVSDLSYLTQNTGEKLERPDISGYDSSGKEVVILEAKFWAALTNNQPIEYLNRLGPDSALIFICPTLRVRTIYNELVKKIRETESTYQVRPELHAILLGNNKHVIVKTWDEILGTLRFQLVQANDQTLLSDIDQIIGLCHTIDSHSFIPLQNDDLSPSIARRINSYYDLVDKVTDELIKRGIANTDGLKATPQRNGYTRYLHIGNYGVALHLNFNFWARDADTPFWITVKEIIDSRWMTTGNLVMASKNVAAQLNLITVQTNQKALYFALLPLLDKTEDIVVSHLAQQIITLTQALERKINNL